MHKLRLYNTASRKLEIFEPLEPPYVGMYACGLTVYDFAHVGNLRTYLFEDVLRRTLEANGFVVKHVQNITDVGHLADDSDDGVDKMEVSAERQKISAALLARSYTEAFLGDMKTLNILHPNIMPKATEHIQDMITLIQRLEKRGYTYKTSDGIYFDTARYPAYGQITRLHNQSLREGARVAKNPEKKNPHDFALWKFSPKDHKRQMEWGSPWGVGFPGWHIECSAMAMRYLGETFDIHCGGIDHVPIHHTNEIAQSEAATGKQFAKYWLHGEFLRTDQTRMGKSEGNALTLSELTKRGYPALAYRYLVLNTHYRKPLLFSWEALDAAKNAFAILVEKVQSFSVPKVGCAEFEEKFMDAMNDDLNTPKALGIMWDMLKSEYPNHAKLQTLLFMDRVLGFGIEYVKPFVVPKEVQKLVTQREKAREQKKYSASDDLRRQIEQLGYSLEDAETGTVVKKK